MWLLNNQIIHRYKIFVFAFVVIGFSYGCKRRQSVPRVLVFSKTAGWRHIQAIESGKKMFLKMGQQHGFKVDTTEDAHVFTDTILCKYRAVVFLNVSGNVFDQQQQTAFQRYIEAGGGFLAIHASTDAERDWPWYGKLIGAYFESHSSVQKGTYVVVDSTNPATDSLPHRWTGTDEFYNFEQVNPNIHTLIKVDERSYQGGTMGKNHQMVWYHNFDGGRSFYTAMGHIPKSYSQPLFKKIIWGGLQYVMGGNNPALLDYSRAKPEANRFSKHLLVQGMNEPMEMDIAKDGRIFVAERRGSIVVYDPQKDSLLTIGHIPVMTRYEDGLLGLVLDPDFSTNQWLYLYYSSPGGKYFKLSRFKLDNQGKLLLNSEKNLLSIPKQVFSGSHTGGGLAFDKNTGDLYITVGGNTSPRGSGYAPIDERPGRAIFNAARSSGNTNDLRGKILRIHPEANGTYSIPEGNLFPPGTPNTRPEIYIMGNRQPWRVTVDSKTGWLYWGEVGPDARTNKKGRGPIGYDEFNQAKKPGNYGWPFVIGPNLPYWDYNFVTGDPGKLFDPNRPVNNSKYNTGLRILPPAQPAFIWYPYAKSNKFPLLGSGGRTAVGGPIFRKADFSETADGLFPSYYEGKWFVTDFTRGWLNVISIDSGGNYEWMEPLIKGLKLKGPLDMKFGPDGSLYVLNYGYGWFMENSNAGIIRIDYNAGNRPPKVHISADRYSGSLPLTVALSSQGSLDYDHDKLQYSWKISSSKNKQEAISSALPNPAIKLNKPGIYTATLTVTDDKGNKNSQSIKIIAGNEAPDVRIKITQGNSSFFFPRNPIQYQVDVVDKEDGSLDSNTIPDSSVIVNITYQDNITQYLATEKAKMKGVVNHQSNYRLDIAAPSLINGSDCYSCHQLNSKSIGPSFKMIADRYKLNDNTISKLANKVIKGGSGNWGQVAMSAHPELPEQKAQLIIRYILTRNEHNRKKQNKKESGHVDGRLSLKSRGGKNANGGFVIRAGYTDKGNNDLPALSAHDQLVLRYPQLLPQNANHKKGLMTYRAPNAKSTACYLYGNGAYIGYDHIDLTNISGIEVQVTPWVGGYFEIHAGTPEGEILGTSISEESLAPDTDSSIYIKIRPTSGRENIYLVAKNDTAKYYSILFKIRSVLFKSVQN